MDNPLGFLLGTGAISEPIPICENTVTSLGRDEGNTVPLDDLAASRRHALIEGSAGAIFLTDLASSNGTFVNEVQVKAHEKIRLSSGQEVRIGGKVFFVVSADAPLETERMAMTRGAFSRKSTLVTRKSKSGKLNVTKPRSLKIPFSPLPAQEPGALAQRRQKLPGDLAQKLNVEVTQKTPVARDADTFDHSLAGDIAAGGLPQIIQMIHAKRFSGTMKITGGSNLTTILFVNGELYAAFSGGVKGMEAIFACALEEGTRFTFNRLEVCAVEITPRNITRGTMQILMDCCCKVHEASQRRK